MVSLSSLYERWTSGAQRSFTNKVFPIVTLFLGIVLAVALTVASLWFLRRFVDRRTREDAPGRLEAAKAALENDDRAAAFALAGEAFWASPTRVYRPEEAKTAAEVLRVARTCLGPRADELAPRLDDLIRELEDCTELGGAISAENLDDVAQLLHDVSADRFLADRLLELKET